MYSRLVSETYPVLPAVFPIIGRFNEVDTTIGVGIDSRTVGVDGLDTGIHVADAELYTNVLPNSTVVWPFVGDDGNVIVCSFYIIPHYSSPEGLLVE